MLTQILVLPSLLQNTATYLLFMKRALSLLNKRNDNSKVKNLDKKFQIINNYGQMEGYSMCIGCQAR